eukprot:11219412-Lingulodinium_polyedra.AAC.1
MDQVFVLFRHPGHLAGHWARFSHGDRSGVRKCVILLEPQVIYRRSVPDSTVHPSSRVVFRGPAAAAL